MPTQVLLLDPRAALPSLSFALLSWTQGTTVMQCGDDLETKADTRVLAPLILHHPSWCKDQSAPREPLAEPSLLHWEHSPPQEQRHSAMQEMQHLGLTLAQKTSIVLTNFIWRVNNLSQVGISLRNCSDFSPCALHRSGYSGTEGLQSIL